MRPLAAPVLALSAALLGASLAAAAPATAAPPGGATVLATGLEDPSGLSDSGGGFLVAEPAAGRISRVPVHGGTPSPLVTGLVGPSSAVVADGRLLVLTGGSEVPDAKSTGDATLFTATTGGQHLKVLANLKAFELAHNPDGQPQFDAKGAPLDALSNPFSVIPGRGSRYALVADAGANDVLSVSRSGKVSVFFLPPVVTTGLCKGETNNGVPGVGCDPVPTGLAYGPHNSLYVSTLSALTPHEGRVYVLDASSGKVRRVISDLDAPTGIAVAPDGTVYVSEVTYGAPEGEGPPPAGFDPSTVGRIVRIDCDGSRTYAAVPMPLGLDWRNGKLYSTAWSIASEVGMKGAGQLVAVPRSAFAKP